MPRLVRGLGSIGLDGQAIAAHLFPLGQQALPLFPPRLVGSSLSRQRGAVEHDNRLNSVELHHTDEMHRELDWVSKIFKKSCQRMRDLVVG